MRFFFPDDSIWEVIEIKHMLNRLIPWMEQVIPAFSYFADYYLDYYNPGSKNNQNSYFEKEPHHILGFAAIYYFKEYCTKNITDWALQAFFDTFISLNNEADYYKGRIALDFLTDSLSYRWFLFQSLNRSFDIFLDT